MNENVDDVAGVYSRAESKTPDYLSNETFLARDVSLKPVSKRWPFYPAFFDVGVLRGDRKQRIKWQPYCWYIVKELVKDTTSKTYTTNTGHDQPLSDKKHDHLKLCMFQQCLAKKKT